MRLIHSIRKYIKGKFLSVVHDEKTLVGFPATFLNNYKRSEVQAIKCKVTRGLIL